MTESINSAALKEIATTLINDAEVDGWDQPHTLYAIAGTLDDPYLIKLAILNGHPIPALGEIYDEGYRVEDGWLGLALTTEAWTHLTYEQLLEALPEGTRKAVEEIVKVAGADLDQEERDKMVRKSLMETQAHIPPSALPPHLRREIRTMTLHLRDGATFGAHRFRGEDTVEFFGIGVGDQDDTKIEGAVPEALARFVDGQHPVEEESNAVPPASSLN